MIRLLASVSTRLPGGAPITIVADASAASGKVTSSVSSAFSELDPGMVKASS